jgi:hypothetical protein
MDEGLRIESGSITMSDGSHVDVWYRPEQDGVREAYWEVTHRGVILYEDDYFDYAMKYAVDFAIDSEGAN